MISFELFKKQLSARGIYTSTQISNFLLKNCNIHLTPGSEFGVPENIFLFRASVTMYDGPLMVRL